MDDDTPPQNTDEAPEAAEAVGEDELAELTADAVSTMPVYVVGETPDGKLLTHDSDVPVRTTVVWFADSTPDESMTVGEVMARYERPYDVLMYVEPEPYDPEAPNQVQPAELDDARARLAAIEAKAAAVEAKAAALEAKVAALDLARQPVFPSGLSYGTAGLAHRGDPAARGEVIAHFESMSTPDLAPSEFAAKVAGLEPPASDDMREVWEAIGSEAKTWQALQVAKAVTPRSK